MRRGKGAAYVVLMLSIQTPFSLPNDLRRVLPFTTNPKMTKRAAFLQEEACTTFNSSISDGVVAKRYRMKQKEISSRQVLGQSDETKINQAMSQTVLHSAFETSDVLPGRHCLSQCGRPVFKMETLHHVNQCLAGPLCCLRTPSVPHPWSTSLIIVIIPSRQ